MLILNQLKVSIRNLLQFKIYGLLNLATLAIAFSSVFLIGIYIHYEMSFDDFHTQSSQIYRVTYKQSDLQGFDVEWARIPVDYVNELPKDFPDIQRLIRFQNQEQKYLRIGDQTFKPKHAYITDKDIFEVFDYEFVLGSASTALSRPNSIVLTETLTRTYFGSADPLGQTVHMVGDWSPDEVAYQVTGVVADPPENTHLPVEILMSFASEEARKGWAYVYIQTTPSLDVRSLESRFESFVDKHQKEGADTKVAFRLQPLSDIHLHSDLAREIIPNGNARNIRSFFFIALLILIIALINYMNLSSTLLMTRRKEMGVRRILGALNMQLRRSLIIISIGTNLLAIAVGVLVTYLLFPHFRALTETQFLIEPWLAIILVIGLGTFCGLLTGWYPSNVLKRSRSASQTDAGGISFGIAATKGMEMRRILLATQFTISILLVTSAYLASKQFQYIKEKQLGLNIEQVVAIPSVSDHVTSKYNVFREKLEGIPNIRSIAACMQVPSQEIRDVGKVLVYGMSADKEKAPLLDIQIIDQSFPDLMQFEWLAGDPDRWKDIEPNNVSLSTSGLSAAEYLLEQPRGYLINESALRLLGWDSPESAIGQRINWSNSVFDLAYGPILGVVADYHQETLHNRVDPIVMTYEKIWLRTFVVKIESAAMKETLSQVEAVWSQLFPSYALEYHFLDALYEKLYEQESTQLSLLYIFSGLALFIAFVGLFSLTAFTLRIRSREIAIRQILGADLRSLVKTFGRDYAILFAIGAVVAIPFAIYGVSNWLDDFAYHIDITAAPFLIVLMAVGASLFAIVVLQVLSKSRASPSDVLRDG